MSHNNGIPTNLSVRNCEIPSYFNTYNIIKFKEQNEPRMLNDYINLNPQAIDSKYDKSFAKTNNGYTTNDPRLISAFHNGQHLHLDTPPINGGQVKLADIYTDVNMKNYGQKYTSYADIKAGDINYYIDRSIEDAFIPEIYQNNAQTTGYLWKDPMGSMKPQYDRKPIYNNNVINTTQNRYNHKLSWLDDSNEYRENLMASQQLKNNQQKYSSRWTGNIHM
jgi:hypothetical protein